MEMATRQQRVAAAAAAAEVRGASAQQLSGLRREVAELAALEDTTRCTLRHLQRMRADLDQLRACAQALAGGEREEWGWSVGPRALATWLPDASVVPPDALAMAPTPTPPAPPLPPPTPRPARTLREALDLDSASGAGVGAWPGSGAEAAGAAAASPGSTDATTTAASLLFCSLVVLREVRAEVRRLRLRMRTRRRAGAGGASRPEEAEEEDEAEAEAVAAAAVAAAGAAAGAAQAAATPEGAERARGGGDAPPADLDAALRGLQPQEQVTVLRAERLRLLREIAAARAEAELRRRLLRGTAGGGEALRQRSSLYEPDDDASIEAARGGPHTAHAPLAPDHAGAASADATALQSLADGRNALLSTAYTGQRLGRAYPSDMEEEAEEGDGDVLSMGPSSPTMAAGALEDGEDEDADSEDGALPDVTGPAEDEENGEAVGQGEDENADERQDEEDQEGKGELNAELQSNEASASSFATPHGSQERRRNEQSAANARVGGAAVAEPGESTTAPGEANEDVMGALPDLP